MILVKTDIPEEELLKFYEKTGRRLKESLELYYMYDDVLDEYYLGFADDMIVIRNGSMTLDNGTITKEALDLELSSRQAFIKRSSPNMLPDFNTTSAGLEYIL